VTGDYHDDYVNKEERFDAAEARRVLGHPVVVAQIANREAVARIDSAVRWLAVLLVVTIATLMFAGYLYVHSVEDSLRQNTRDSCERGQVNGDAVNSAFAQLGVKGPVVRVVKDCNEVVR
jgi:hypothetical protein